MPGWSPAIANEFIRRGEAAGVHFTQMQLQKLVYIAHGWNLAINGSALTLDDPQAWEYGPVYRELRQAVRHYGRSRIDREIQNGEFRAGAFDDAPEATATADLDERECAVIDRVFKDYHKFHAFQLSALTHKPGTPWTKIYDAGTGAFTDIPAAMIRVTSLTSPPAEPRERDPNLTLDAIGVGVSLAAKALPDAQDRLERDEIEIEALKLRNQLSKAHLKSAKADRRMRQQYAGRILRYLEYYSGVVALLVLLAGFKPLGFSIDSTVLSTLVGSTAVAAIGLVGFIARGLFRTPEIDQK